MFVLKFNTQEEAEQRSFQEAAVRLGENHTTELWWGWIYKGNEYWLLVDQNTPDAIEITE